MYKNHYIIILCSLIFGKITFAQTKEPYEINISGVKVIVQPSNNDIVEIQTIITGGVQNYSVDKQGIEALATAAITECGTEKENKDDFKNKLDKVGGYIAGYTGDDYATIRMNCIKSDFETVWPLYVHAITVPLFDANEFEKVKQDAVNSLKAAASQPDYSIDIMARQIAFAGKDYAKQPDGTETTLKNITANECKAYYKSILTKSKMFIIVVGEIDKNNLEKKISQLLTSVPKGEPFILKKESYLPLQSSFKSESKQLATNYIKGIGGAPLVGSEDYNAFKLAMRIFANRHFVEIRTKNALSYAPGAWFSAGTTGYSTISVSTTNPNKYINVFKNLVGLIKKNGFTEEEVRDMKTTYLTNFYYQQESNNAQAASMAYYQALLGDWRKYLTIKSDLEKVSLAEVNKAFDKYINNFTWVLQGTSSKSTEVLFRMPRMGSGIAALINRNDSSRLQRIGPMSKLKPTPIAADKIERNSETISMPTIKRPQ